MTSLLSVARCLVLCLVLSFSFVIDTVNASPPEPASEEMGVDIPDVDPIEDVSGKETSISDSDTAWTEVDLKTAVDTDTGNVEVEEPLEESSYEEYDGEGLAEGSESTDLRKLIRGDVGDLKSICEQHYSGPVSDCQEIVIQDEREDMVSGFAKGATTFGVIVVAVFLAATG